MFTTFYACTIVRLFDLYIMCTTRIWMLNECEIYYVYTYGPQHGMCVPGGAHILIKKHEPSMECLFRIFFEKWYPRHAFLATLSRFWATRDLHGMPVENGCLFWHLRPLQTCILGHPSHGLDHFDIEHSMPKQFAGFFNLEHGMHQCLQVYQSFKMKKDLN